MLPFFRRVTIEIPGVTVTLSGMSNMQQLEENLSTFEAEHPLNQQEMETLLGIADSMVQKTSVPCTACRYCTSHCPQSLDIPMLLELYNEHCFTGGGFIAPMALIHHPNGELILCQKRGLVLDILKRPVEIIHLQLTELHGTTAAARRSRLDGHWDGIRVSAGILQPSSRAMTFLI